MSRTQDPKGVSHRQSNHAGIQGNQRGSPVAEHHGERLPGRKPIIAFARLRLGPSSAVSLEVVKAIREVIEDGSASFGTRLPSERNLAVMLGVSRTSLRDALKVLAGMGLVDVRRGSGVYVGPASRSLLDVTEGGRRRRSTGKQSSGTVAELFELRTILETAAARWAAERASQGEIKAIAQRLAQFSRWATETELSAVDADRYDSTVHEMIARASRNRTLVRTLSGLRKTLTASGQREEILKPERIAKNLVELGEVVEALKARDPQRAAAAMRLHVTHGAMANLRQRRRH